MKSPQTCPAMLGRLRASTRLAVLVLLGFALNFTSAFACATHDYADIGLGGDPAAIAHADDGAGDGVAPPFENAGACSHCGVHHAAAIPVDARVVSVPNEGGIATRRVALRLDPEPGEDLRPPIV